jgi:integrase
MKDRGKASGTCNRVLILLRYAFNLARKWKVPGARENPTAGLVTAPQVNCDRFLSREEAKRLIGFINSDENRTAANSIMLLLLTGARRNEVTMAKWEFVDWNKHTLLVPLSKSGKPRLVSLNADALALLRSLTPIGGNPYIFPSPLTNVPSPSLFYPFDRMRQRAGLKDVRLHDLRHSFASFLVNRGVPLYTVQGLLGHTQPRTTQRYAHLAPQTLLNAAEAISDALRDEPPEPDES